MSCECRPPQQCSTCRQPEIIADLEAEVIKLRGNLEFEMERNVNNIAMQSEQLRIFNDAVNVAQAKQAQLERDNKKYRDALECVQKHAKHNHDADFKTDWFQIGSGCINAVAEALE